MTNITEINARHNRVLDAAYARIRDLEAQLKQRADVATISETSYIVLATFEREDGDYTRAYGPMLWDDARKARNNLLDELGAYSVQVF